MIPVYDVSKLTIRRGDATLLDAVSLRVCPGQVLGLIGPNGAGKSTLMNVLAGDLAPDAGDVTLQGRSIDRWSPAELSRMRAVLPQQTLLQFGFRADEVVAMGRLPLPPCAPHEEEAALNRVMTQTDTGHLADRVYPLLSGGEQSRVSLARVLAQETPVVLLDEPTASLDIRHQHDVMRIAREIANNGGTVIAILHDLNLAMSYADRLGLLHRGALVTLGTPWEIATSGLLPEVFDYPLAVIQHPAGPQPLIVPCGPGRRDGDAPVMPANVRMLNTQERFHIRLNRSE